MEPMRRRKTRQRRSKRRLRRDGLALQQRTRDLAASTVRSMVDVLDTVVDKESLRTGYNYLSGGVRGVMVTIVTAAIVMVGLPLEPILSSVDKPTWRRITSYFQAVWSTLCIGLINPVHLIKSGEFPDSSTKPKILICNHVTDVDWVRSAVFLLSTKLRKVCMVAGVHVDSCATDARGQKWGREDNNEG